MSSTPSTAYSSSNMVDTLDSAVETLEEISDTLSELGTNLSEPTSTDKFNAEEAAGFINVIDATINDLRDIRAFLSSYIDSDSINAKPFDDDDDNDND